jgi:hypothetical protein
MTNVTFSLTSIIFHDMVKKPKTEKEWIFCQQFRNGG